jgi:hypothetical protein
MTQSFFLYLEPLAELPQKALLGSSNREAEGFIALRMSK